MKSSRLSIEYRKNDVLFLYICFSIVLFGLTSTLITYIISSSMIRTIIAGGAFALELLICVSYDIKKESFKYILLISLMLFLSFYNSAWPIRDVLIYGVALGASLIAFRTLRLVKIVVPCLLAGSGFYAFFTIFLYFNRNIYMNYVVNLFPEEKARLIGWYNRGCMAGLTSHYSTNAMFISVGLLIMFCKWYNKRNIYSFSGVVFFSVALLLTGKRGHIIFVLLALLVVYYLSMKDRRIAIKLLKIMGVVMVLGIIGVIIFINVPALATFINRFISTARDDDISKGRFELWGYALKTFAHNPILGIGWKDYELKVSYLYSSTKTYDVHNVYFQLLCETGIIGFTIYITWFTSMYISTVRKYRKVILQNVNSVQKYYLSISLAIQTFFLLYCVTGNPLYDKPMYFPYFISCSITIYFITNRNIWYNVNKNE